MGLGLAGTGGEVGLTGVLAPSPDPSSEQLFLQDP